MTNFPLPPTHEGVQAGGSADVVNQELRVSSR
jgi:hypothetical protein